MDIFLRRLIVEHPVAQKDQTKSSLELCNSFAINSQITRLKLKRENTNNNKRSLKKQEILFFSPFFLVVVPLSTPEPFLAGCLWRLITIKALALFICLVQRMAKDIIARR